VSRRASRLCPRGAPRPLSAPAPRTRPRSMDGSLDQSGARRVANASVHVLGGLAVLPPTEGRPP
jgi:hypothetical protein